MPTPALDQRGQGVRQLILPHVDQSVLAVVRDLYGPDDRGTRSSGSGRAMLFLPSASRPKIVVPSGQPHAAAAAIDMFTSHRHGVDRWKFRALSWLVRTGLADRARAGICIADAGLDKELSRFFDQPVHSSMRLGPPRANRKPVLCVATSAGNITGVAKVAMNTLTRKLIRNEARALEILPTLQLRTLDTPRLLTLRQWQGHQILIESPVSTTGEKPPARVLSHALRDLAMSRKVITARADASPYLSDLHSDLQHLGGTGRQVADALRGAVQSQPQRLVHHGTWHGDLTPWNCSLAAGDTLSVWDWERFADGVPLGYDALHYATQQKIAGRTPTPRDAMHAITQSRSLLSGFDVPLEDREFTAVCYLSEIARRYLGDAQDKAGARAGHVDRWIAPGLSAWAASR